MGNYDSNRYTYRGHKQTKLGGPTLFGEAHLISPGVMRIQQETSKL